MIIAACVDEAMGLQFNGRRQSRDRIVMEQLCAMAGDRLRVSPASAKLMEPGSAYVGEDYLTGAGAGDWCFVEDTSYLALEQEIQQIVLFQWNRSYPADLYFQFPGEWTAAECREFAGSSHEKITVEVYRK